MGQIIVYVYLLANVRIFVRQKKRKEKRKMDMRKRVSERKNVKKRKNETTRTKRSQLEKYQHREEKYSVIINRRARKILTI